MGDPDAILIDYRRLRDEIRSLLEGAFGGKASSGHDQMIERKTQ